MELYELDNKVCDVISVNRSSHRKPVLQFGMANPVADPPLVDIHLPIVVDMPGMGKRYFLVEGENKKAIEVYQIVRTQEGCYLVAEVFG